VAVVEHLEGRLGAVADERHEALVGRRARDRADGRRSLHAWVIDGNAGVHERRVLA
jgi:hypothetical protein